MPPFNIVVGSGHVLVEIFPVIWWEISIHPGGTGSKRPTHRPWGCLGRLVGWQAKLVEHMSADKMPPLPSLICTNPLKRGHLHHLVFWCTCTPQNEGSFLLVWFQETQPLSKMVMSVYCALNFWLIFLAYMHMLTTKNLSSLPVQDNTHLNTCQAYLPLQDNTHLNTCQIFTNSKLH